MILRDSHGVAQVRYITGNKILRILKAKGTHTMLILDSKPKKHLISCLNTLHVSTYMCNGVFFLLLGLAGNLPEDLYFLIKKAVAVRKHLEKHRKVGEEFCCI